MGSGYCFSVVNIAWRSAWALSGFYRRIAHNQHIFSCDLLPLLMGKFQYLNCWCCENGMFFDQVFAILRFEGGERN